MWTVREQELIITYVQQKTRQKLLDNKSAEDKKTAHKRESHVG